jgi:hypothetical protein
MTTFSESLMLFKEAVASGTMRAPDNYPEWDKFGFPRHKEDLVTLWAEIRPRLKRDLEEAAFIDEHLKLALESFDRGDREPGQSIMCKIYNVLNQKKLR